MLGRKKREIQQFWPPSYLRNVVKQIRINQNVSLAFGVVDVDVSYVLKVVNWRPWTGGGRLVLYTQLSKAYTWPNHHPTISCLIGTSATFANRVRLVQNLKQSLEILGCLRVKFIGLGLGLLANMHA